MLTHGRRDARFRLWWQNSDFSAVSSSIERASPRTNPFLLHRFDKRTLRWCRRSLLP